MRPPFISPPAAALSIYYYNEAEILFNVDYKRNNFFGDPFF
jgi:hypothetical protein